MKSGRANATLKPVAWRARDAVVNPPEIRTDGDDWRAIEAPQRGYVVYA